MLDPKNIINITGGLTADPEIIADGKIVKLRLAVNYAGSPNNTEDADNKSGYFDVTYYVNDKEAPNTRFVLGQINDSKMKRGSQIQIIGRLHQDRFITKDERKAERVMIVAEAITYAGSPNREKDEASGPSSSGSASNAPAASSSAEEEVSPIRF